LHRRSDNQVEVAVCNCHMYMQNNLLLLVENSCWLILHSNIVAYKKTEVQSCLLKVNSCVDVLQAWHARQRQRATRAEKLRFQALKADDQEAYMRMVEESKNERLTTLLEKTNQLLVRLGAAVQRQKDAEHADDSKTTEQGVVEPTTEEDEEVLADMDGDHARKKTDLLEGQRQYNSVIHSIQEKVNHAYPLL